MNQPLLTIILPNRGRIDLLSHTIQSILASDDERFELVINDNSWPDESKIEVTDCDKRIEVHYEKEKLSMNKNFFNGLSRAKGEWVCFIGSDDGIVSGSLSPLIDFLQVCRADLVTTHPIYFQYALQSKPPWADLPSRKIKTWECNINFFPKLAVAFPQFKLDLPVPYNRSVVRKKVLQPILDNFTELPGVSHDDFLGQFIAQANLSSKYLELPVFIHAGSNASNGYQLGQERMSSDARDFLQHAKGKYGRLLNKYGLECPTALAYEHYQTAKLATIGSGSKLIVEIFVQVWAELICSDANGHHSKNQVLVLVRKVGRYFHFQTYRFTRKVIRLVTFGVHQPIPNKKKTMPADFTVLDISQIVEELVI